MKFTGGEREEKRGDELLGRHADRGGRAAADGGEAHEGTLLSSLLLLAIVRRQLIAPLGLGLGQANVGMLLDGRRAAASRLNELGHVVEGIVVVDLHSVDVCLERLVERRGADEDEEGTWIGTTSKRA